MRQGEKRLVSLPAEKAYGTRDPSKIRKYDRNRETPRTITMGPKDFVNQFGRLPVTGKEVSINPYFSSKIVEVAEDHVTLEHLAVPGNHTEAIGNTEISVEGDRILLKLTPRVGAPFTIDGSEGSISALDEKTFSVDGNHPAAGHPVRVAIEVVSVAAASALKAMELPWTEDYEGGLSRAKKEGIPAVLVLYSSSCDWCHKLINESFADPMVKPYRDCFVWIKINSEERQEYKLLYGQDNFPATVLLRPDGTVVRKIEGFRNAGGIIKELGLDHAGAS
jgi:FKBP-type peptidyl-prolyl cis-trans isomerase 2